MKRTGEEPREDSTKFAFLIFSVLYFSLPATSIAMLKMEKILVKLHDFGQIFYSLMQKWIAVQNDSPLAIFQSV